VGSGRGQVSAYPRQLESLIRLAEAHAKIRFSQTVEESDVDEAFRCCNFKYLFIIHHGKYIAFLQVVPRSSETIGCRSTDGKSGCEYFGRRYVVDDS
jgi:hypothetical protein